MNRTLRFLDHAMPLLKRMMLATSVSLAIGLIRFRLGYHSPFFNVITVIGSVLFADWACSSAEERSRWWRRIWSASFAEMARVCLWFVSVAILLHYLAFETMPHEPTVLALLNFVEIWGFIVVLMVPLITAVLNTSAWSSLESLGHMALRLMPCFALYVGALMGIRAFGDEAYLLISANPSAFVVFAVSLAIVGFLANVTFDAVLGTGKLAESVYQRGVFASGISLKATTQDEHYIAAHEAGHAMVYAALNPLPPTLSLAIKEESSHDGVLGFLSGVASPHLLKEKAYAEWNMLLMLAGKAGEIAQHGESTLGSSTDLTRWLRVAQAYLANHNKGIFYTEPTTDLERQLNESKLMGLQSDQFDLLSQMFVLNAPVFKDLIAALLEKRKLSHDDIKPFLSRVILPSGFPRPPQEFWKSRD